MAKPLRRLPRVGPRSNIHREPEGWSVIMMRKSRTFVHYFGNAVWGSRALALLAAQRFRDELLLRIDPDTRVRRQIPQGRRSETGVVGVSLDRRSAGDRVYEYFLASWEDPEKGEQRRRFRIEHHGRARALALAIEARQAGIAQSHAYLLARQREEAARRLQRAAKMPRPVKDPLSRKGIRMRRRRPRRVR